MVVRTATPTRAASLGSISLRASHLAHGDDVGVETKGNVQQCDLVDALPLILAVTGLGMWTTELTTLPFCSRMS